MCCILQNIFRSVRSPGVKNLPNKILHALTFAQSLSILGLNQGPSVPLDVRRFEGEQAERNNAALKKLFEELPNKSRAEKLQDAFDAMGHLHNVPVRGNVGGAARVSSSDDA